MLSPAIASTIIIKLLLSPVDATAPTIIPAVAMAIATLTILSAPFSSPVIILLYPFFKPTIIPSLSRCVESISLAKMITINDVTYEEADLTPEAIANVARVNELRKELNAHQMRSAELNVLISAYANAIKASVEIVEEDEDEAVEA